MATAITHSFAAAALDTMFFPEKMPRRFWVLAVLCGIIPDIDVVGFRLGIRYGDLFGHRGFLSTSPCIEEKKHVLFGMQFRACLILALMALVVTAPAVDATICPDCNDTAPFPGTSREIMTLVGHAAQWSPSDAGFASPSTEDVQDLCPFCSQSIAAGISLSCRVPTTIRITNQLPKLLALSTLSKSITKPPQN